MAYAIQRSVKAERARLGLNQEQFGERMGWPTSTVSDVETGKRSVLAQEMPRLCEALETTLPDLLAKVPEALRRMGI